MDAVAAIDQRAHAAQHRQAGQMIVDPRQLEGDGARQDSSLTTQVVRQVRTELEDILQVLKR